MKDTLTVLLIIAATYGAWRAFEDWQAYRDEQTGRVVYRAARRGAEDAFVCDQMVLPFPPEARRVYGSN